MKIAVVGATGRVGCHLLDILTERGADVVAIARSKGVDIITGEGLDPALAGVECIIDVATGPSPEQGAATEFFTTAARNLHAAGERARVARMLVVSIIGADRFTSGYNAAKFVHEQAHLAGPIPTRVLRAAQFHELVPLMLEWGTRGEVAYVPSMPTQLVAARTVAETLADLATDTAPIVGDAPIPQIAGPRRENMVDAARLLVARRGDRVRVEVGNDPTDPDNALYEQGALLPAAHAKLAGPTFEQWVATQTA